MTLATQFSDAEMYNQLRYFAYLFDVEKAAKAATGQRRGEYSPVATITLLTSSADHLRDVEDILALGTLQADFLQRMSGAVEKYLDKNGRRWVDMGSLFSFMKI